VEIFIQQFLSKATNFFAAGVVAASKGDEAFVKKDGSEGTEKATGKQTPHLL